VARGSGVGELSACRFLDLDAELDSEMDWDVSDVEAVGVARGFDPFARRYRNFTGGVAWFWIGSISVIQVS